MAVLSGHTSQKAATAALGRPCSQASSRSSSGAGEEPVLQVRAAKQISSRRCGQPGWARCRAARAAAVTVRPIVVRRDRSWL